MPANTPAIRIGTASANAAHAADLGKVITVNGKRYRLVKNTTGALATAAGKLLVSAQSGGQPTWVVTTTTTANDQFVVGVVPVGQVGSSGTTSLLAGDYFYVQIAGFAAVKGAAGIADGDMLAASTTAGSVGVSASTTTQVTAAMAKGICAVALEAVSATTTGYVGVRLVNLD